MVHLSQRQQQSLTTLILVGLLAACQPDASVSPSSTRPHIGSNFAASHEEPRQSMVRSLDDDFADLVDRVPGFGGMFVDSDGVLNVYLTDPDRQEELSGRISEFLTQRSPRRRQEIAAAVANIRVRKAAYDFRQLHNMYSRITATLPPSGITLSDIADDENRIVIGVIDKAAADRVTKALIDLGIPADAYAVREIPPMIISQSSAENLKGYTRPTSAGLQIQIGSNYCTLGFNAHATHPAGGVDTSEGYFITNSHCEDNFGRVSGAAAGQPTLSYVIADEFIDPPLFTRAVDSRCPSGRMCRYSDATVFKYRSNSTYQFGRSARTNGPGNFNIPGYNWFVGTERLLASCPNCYLLYKVGSATGYQSGSGHSVCVDLPQHAVDPYIGLYDTGRTMLCQDLVIVNSQGGDSGAPVHSPPVNGVDIQLFGIHWGSDGTRAAMSPIRYIQQEVLQASGLMLVPCNNADCVAQ